MLLLQLADTFVAYKSKSVSIENILDCLYFRTEVRIIAFHLFHTMHIRAVCEVNFAELKIFSFYSLSTLTSVSVISFYYLRKTSNFKIQTFFKILEKTEIQNSRYASVGRENNEKRNFDFAQP